MQQGHVLKFLHTSRKPQRVEGIRTFPKQTYGVSQQSPQEFRQEYTLTGEHGYSYRHENCPQFYYPSQRKSYNIHSGQLEEDYTRLHVQLLENQQAFHRKKGRLSEFMDRNGWMSPVMPIMGFERGQQARALSNRDRDQRIKSMKVRPTYDSKSKQPKVNQEYFNTISSLMSQKLKIRKERNYLNELNPITARNSQVIKQKQEPDPIHVEAVVENMVKTSLDFYSTTSTFYPRNEPSRAQSRTARSKNTRDSPSKISFRSSLTRRAQSPSKSYKEPLSPPKSPRILDEIQKEDQNVQNWYRKTCQANWVFRPKEVDSDEDI